jgi:hypothetical protein
MSDWDRVQEEIEKKRLKLEAQAAQESEARTWRSKAESKLAARIDKFIVDISPNISATREWHLAPNTTPTLLLMIGRQPFNVKGPDLTLEIEIVTPGLYCISRVEPDARVHRDMGLDDLIQKIISVAAEVASLRGKSYVPPLTGSMSKRLNRQRIKREISEKFEVVYWSFNSLIGVVCGLVA